MKTLKKAPTLTEARQLRADRIFAEIYLDGESVEDHDGWEFTEASKESTDATWGKRVYLRSPMGVIEPTTSAIFSIVFEANTATPVTAALNDKELQMP